MPTKVVICLNNTVKKRNREILPFELICIFEYILKCNNHPVLQTERERERIKYLY